MAVVSNVDRLDEGADWKTSVPQYRLASDSVLIGGREAGDTSELFLTMQKVVRQWEMQGISNYLVIKSSQDLGWEMVPFSGTPASTWDRICAFGRQLLILSRVTFGRAELSSTVSDTPNAVEVVPTAQEITQDAFCTEAVVERQRIWEGKHIRVLYNYAPIGQEGLHYLLVSKAHREKFSELNQDEFDEVQQFAGELMERYPEHLCYRYHKTGRLAGQTVPHFHEHVVFMRPHHDLMGKLSLFFRMVMPPTPLNEVELAGRVKELKAYLSKN